MSSDLSDKKGSKCGCLKSERKEFDNELFKKFKKSNIDQEDSDIYRYEFQKKKLDEFQKGKFIEGKCILMLYLQLSMIFSMCYICLY